MNSEKRALLALGICFVVLFFYPRLFMKNMIKSTPAKTPAMSAPAQAGSVSAAPLPNAAPIEQETKIAQVVNGSAETETFYKYEDSNYSAKISSHGGSIKELTLQEMSNDKAVYNQLIKPASNLTEGLGLRFLHQGQWTLGFFRAAEQAGNKVSVISESVEGLKIQQTYAFFPEKQSIFLDVLITNTSSETKTVDYELVTPLYTGHTEGQEKTRLEIDYYDGEKIKMRAFNKIRKEGYSYDGPLEWLALEKQYSAIIVKPEAKTRQFRTFYYENEGFVQYLRPESKALAPGEVYSTRFFIYAGQQDIKVLKSFDLGYEQILYGKVLGGLWMYFLSLLHLLFQLTGNYGVAIILFACLVKACFFPLTSTMYRSMKKMQELQPKLKALQEQYKDDQQRYSQEMMALFKKHKVNPYGGCLPLLIQMPILMALFSVFYQALELRGAPFVGWIQDLSLPDHFWEMPMSLPYFGKYLNLLPLFMVASMIWQQQLMPKTSMSKDQEMMMKIMPVMMSFFFYHLPAGLVLYWTVQNCLTILYHLGGKKIFAAIWPEKTAA